MAIRLIRLMRDNGARYFVFAFLVLCFFLHPASAVWTHQLQDADDYMRLVQTMNWMGGAGWYDLSMPRLDSGVILPWSRFVDLPIAAVAFVFSLATDLREALLAAAFIVPPLLLVGVIVLLPMAARPLLSRRDAPIAALLLIFAFSCLTRFMPGRVDHHGWQLLIALFDFVALMRLLFCERSEKWAVAAGAASAIGCWIGTEAVPFIAVFCFCLAMGGAWRGGPVSKRAAVFGAAFAIFTSIALCLARPLNAWGDLAITWFSSAHLLFACLVAFVLAASWLVRSLTRRRWLRLFFVCALGMVAAEVFALIVPNVLAGPLADMEKFSAPIVLDHVSEARPFLMGLKGLPFIKALPLFLRYLFLPLCASLLVVSNICLTRGKRRWIWGILALYLLPCFMAALFWQLRILPFVSLFAILPMAHFVARDWHFNDLSILKRVGVILLVGVLPVGVAPFLIAGHYTWTDVALFPAARKADACHFYPVGAALSTDKSAQTILAPMNDGPQILFWSPHSVFAAPYNVPGNQDVLDFFTIRDDEAALRILRKRKVDRVLFCRRLSPFYWGVDGWGRFDAALEDGGKKRRLTMAERLISGQIPAFLTPVEIMGNKDYFLFDVRKNKDPQ